MVDMGTAWLLPAIPAIAFLVIALFGRHLPRKGDWIAIGAILASLALFFPVLVDLLDKLDRPNFQELATSGWEWVRFGDFELRLGFFVDQLTVVMLAIVTAVASMVFIYSTGYMKGDSRYGWFFAALCLFVAAMMTLVLADNLLLLYAAWEGVGLGSYLLIGFWHERRSAAEAAKKAFVTTRIGDVGLLIGIILLWREAGTFDISEIIEFAHAGGYNEAYLTVAVLLLFAGAAGKSAQFPLHVWLPDAMEGPTPVSALIHAATMVVAGVYLVARMLPVFDAAAPVALDVVTAIGLTTVMISATMGLVANDLKRVIAYSTLNSLGLMMVALGSGSITAAMLYLFTHGFFKASLFLAAGSVIHETGRQEIRHLGGLYRLMPVTTLVFFIGAMAMAGVPPLSGFWAKDEIIHVVTSHQNLAVAIFLAISVFLTALYMGRVTIVSFFGKPRDKDSTEHAHDAPLMMTLPLLPLTAATLVSGFIVYAGVGKVLGFPGGFGEFVFFEEPESFYFHWDTALVALVATGLGLVGALYLWGGNRIQTLKFPSRLSPINSLLVNKYYVDDIYQLVVDRAILVAGGMVSWFDRNIINDTGIDVPGRIGIVAGWAIKFSQTGKLPNYALAITIGALVLSILFLVVNV